MRLNIRLVRLLEELRAELGGKPVTVTSGYRCPEHNRRVGGATASQHLLGNGADIVVNEVPAAKVAAVAAEVGFTGVGRYSTYTHVDIRPGEPVKWRE